MTAVVSTYLFLAPEGFHLSKAISYAAGILITLFSGILFFIYFRKQR
jgi:hypothetical protein